MDLLDRMGNQGHPEEDHLERYVMKTCSEIETQQLEEHLLVCEDCRIRLYAAEEWVALMKSALPLGPKRQILPRWRIAFGQIGQTLTRPVALAGCVAFVVILCAAPTLLRQQTEDDEVVTLSATRGGADQAISTVSSRRRLILEPDVNGLKGPLELEIVDSAGTPLFSQLLSGESPRVKLNRRLKTGTYWVRINSAESEHTNLRESGLRVQ
jgi:hypothetical protein